METPEIKIERQLNTFIQKNCSTWKDNQTPQNNVAIRRKHHPAKHRFPCLKPNPKATESTGKKVRVEQKKRKDKTRQGHILSSLKKERTTKQGIYNIHCESLAKRREKTYDM